MKTMNELKVAFLDFWPEWQDENFLLPILKKRWDVKIDHNRPDVIFHSIFGRKEASLRREKKILFLGENWRPSGFNTDFSISFDPNSETNYRMPLWQAFILLHPSIKDRLFNRVRHDHFDRFCSFIVSNPGNSFRNSFYWSLLEYKQVHSYGRFLTNDTGLQVASKGKYWRDAKALFFSEWKHKFSIAFENNSYPGYCTEKLMDAFLAGSLPLYWGDPKVGQDWNSKAFINVSRMSGRPAEWIANLDKDPPLFQALYDQPVFLDDQKKRLEENLEGFESWLIEKILK